jgi:hypothetical protein
MISVAGARGWKIDRQHEDRATRRMSAGEQFPNELAIFDHIELKPRRRAGSGAHFLDGTNADGREAERHTRRGGGSGGLYFTASGEHPGKPYGTQNNGMRKMLMEEIYRKIDRTHILQDSLSKTEPFKIRRVSLDGHLGVRSAIDIVEEYLRKPAPGEALIVFE